MQKVLGQHASALPIVWASRVGQGQLGFHLVGMWIHAEQPYYPCMQHAAANTCIHACLQTELDGEMHTWHLQGGGISHMTTSLRHTSPSLYKERPPSPTLFGPDHPAAPGPLATTHDGRRRRGGGGEGGGLEKEEEASSYPRRRMEEEASLPCHRCGWPKEFRKDLELGSNLLASVSMEAVQQAHQERGHSRGPLAHDCITREPPLLLEEFT